MRRFAILDGSVRNATPCAYLSYDPRNDRYSIDIAEGATVNEVPMAFSTFMQRGERTIGSEWSRRWIEERVVPASRQNIGQILKAHELDAYDPFELLVAGEGRSAQDDYYLQELVEKETGVSGPEELGALFARARAEAGLTQRELSRRTGVHQAVISRLERGCANPTVGLLDDIAKGLGKALRIELC